MNVKKSKKKILNQIKNLLQLGTSPNQNEAEAALAKAYELMERYNFSEDQVQGSSISHTDVATFETVPIFLPFIAELLRNFFFTEVLVNKEAPHRVCVLCESKYTAGSTQFFKYLVETLETNIPQTVDVFSQVNIAFALFQHSPLYREEINSGSNFRTTLEAEKLSYLVGFFQALTAKFSQVKQDLRKEGLVLVNRSPEVEAVMEKVGRKDFNSVGQQKQIGDTAMLMRGYRDGNKMSINQQIGAKRGL